MNMRIKENKKRKVKGQTMLLSLVLVILIVMGTMTLLISTVDVFRGEDYVKMHANSLLTSLLKTDSGYEGDIEKCKTIADILYCSETSPSWPCGETKCSDIAGALVDLYIGKALDPKLAYSMKYGSKITALSSDFSNRTAGVYKSNQKVSKKGYDLDIVFLAAEK